MENDGTCAIASAESEQNCVALYIICRCQVYIYIAQINIQSS